MFFKRTSQHEERRRRVLNEEIRGPADASRPAIAPRGASGGEYGQRSFIKSRAHVVDLVPQRYSALALFFLAMVAVIAGLESLYAWMPKLAPYTADGHVAAFDLGGEGSLAAWFSSLQLLAASVVAWIIYSIRRHKQDDYHGRYRIWITAAGVWFVMSVDEAASLHEGFAAMMVVVSGTRIAGDGALWWMMPYTAILAYVGLRLVIEMRRARLATASLLLAGGCYAAAVAARFDLGWVESGPVSVMLKEGCEMAGNLWLLMSMVLYAGYVILESQGLLPAGRQAKRTSAPGDEKPATSRRRRRATTDVEPASPTPSAKRAARTRRDDQEEKRPIGAKITAESVGQDRDERKLSKAERRALRKQKRQQQSAGVR